MHKVKTVKTAVVIDDHPLVTRGIADFLKSHCGFSDVHAVCNTADFWHMMGENHPPAMIVLDFWLPDGAALPLLEQLKAKHESIPVLVMSADDNPAICSKARESGANGFIHKQESPEVFATAVNALLDNGNWFSNMPNHAIYDTSNKELPITLQELGLTARQGEVLGLILQGLPNKRIAQRLSLSEQTVKEHISGILERLKVRNRVEIITKLRGRKLVSN